MAADDKTQIPVGDQENSKTEVTTKDPSPTSVFVHSEPIREEQVQNGVKFLSHPKVKGSPVIYRRSFLEKKGLTKEEIDEAFRLVPDSIPAASTTQPVVTTHVTNQSQPQVLAMQPAPVTHAAPFSKLGIFSPSRYHWTHAVLAVGFLAVSGAGTAILFKNSIVPGLKSWIRKVVLEDEEGESSGKKTESKPSLAEEASAAAKSAAAAAADVAWASHEMLIYTSEEKRYFGELMNLLDMQVREMKSMSNSVKKLESMSNSVKKLESMSNSVTKLEGKNDRLHEERIPFTRPQMFGELRRMSARVKQRERFQRPNFFDNLFQDYTSGGLNQSNGGDGSVPWRQQKNVRITEMDTESDNRNGSSVLTSSNDRLRAQNSWVPPQAPSVVMAEAAGAIRQPKKSASQKEQQLTDDQLLSHSTELSDELQRITKISESAGLMSSTTSEIQQEETSYSEA